MKIIGQFVRNIMCQVNYAFTGTYFPKNQCEATKKVSPSAEICCTKFKHHFGKHSFEEPRPRR